MEIVIFLVFVGVCAFALVWATRKTRAETDLAQRRRKHAREKAARSEKLYTPVDNKLAHSDQVWQTRRQHAQSGVSSLNRFTPKSDGANEPLYDGYSRRDRNHVRDRNAKVSEGDDKIGLKASAKHAAAKAEERVDDGPSMTSIEFEPTETPLART